MSESAFSALQRVLKTQIELFSTVSVEHKAMQSAVIGRDWTTLEAAIGRIHDYSETLTALERERHDAYRQLRNDLGLHGDAGFYDVLTRLDNEPRARLAKLYRELKVAVMRMAGQNESLQSYVDTSSKTLNAVLEELFPQRKGTIYGRSGAVSGSDGRAFVVNQSL